MKTSVGRKFDSLVVKTRTCPAFHSNKSRVGNSCQECCVPPVSFAFQCSDASIFSGKDAMEFQLDIFMHDRQLKALRFSSCTVVRY